MEHPLKIHIGPLVHVSLGTLGTFFLHANNYHIFSICTMAAAGSLQTQDCKIDLLKNVCVMMDNGAVGVLRLGLLEIMEAVAIDYGPRAKAQLFSNAVQKFKNMANSTASNRDCLSLHKIPYLMKMLNLPAAELESWRATINAVMTETEMEADYLESSYVTPSKKQRSASPAYLVVICVYCHLRNLRLVFQERSAVLTSNIILSFCLSGGL